MNEFHSIQFNLNQIFKSYAVAGDIKGNDPDVSFFRIVPVCRALAALQLIDLSFRSGHFDAKLSLIINE